jgi:hypothetical protein
MSPRLLSEDAPRFGVHRETFALVDHFTCVLRTVEIEAGKPWHEDRNVLLSAIDAFRKFREIGPEALAGKLPEALAGKLPEALAGKLPERLRDATDYPGYRLLLEAKKAVAGITPAILLEAFADTRHQTETPDVASPAEGRGDEPRTG